MLVSYKLRTHSNYLEKLYQSAGFRVKMLCCWFQKSVSIVWLCYIRFHVIADHSKTGAYCTSFFRWCQIILVHFIIFCIKSQTLVIIYHSFSHWINSVPILQMSEMSEMKVDDMRTFPFDARFPNQNQTRFVK